MFSFILSNKFPLKLCYYSCSISFLSFLISDNWYELHALSALCILVWGSFCYWVIWNAGELLVKVTGARLFKHYDIFYLVLICALIFLNLYSTILIFKRVELMTLSVAGIAVAVMAGTMWFFKDTGAKFISAAAIVSSAISVTKFLLLSLVFQFDDPKGLPDVSHIKFDSRPNVYLISFDALASERVLAQFYEVENAPHVTMLRDNGFRVLNDVYSAAPLTRASLNLLLAQTPRFYPVGANLVTGQPTNVTYEVFRHNDYKLQFLYKDDYLGFDVGALDFFYPQRQPLDFCRSVPSSILYGICSQFVVDLIVSTGLQNGYGSQVDRIVDRIAAVNSSPAQRWLTYTYIYFPGHTDRRSHWSDLEYMDEYKADYVASLDELSRQMKQIHREIVERDKNAVIVFFGDHGAKVTRGMSLSPAKYPDAGGFSYEDVIREQFGVLLAVYPKSFCQKGLKNNISTLVLAREIISCLSGGKDPLEDEHTNKSYLNNRVVVEDGEIVR